MGRVSEVIVVDWIHSFVDYGCCCCCCESSWGVIEAVLCCVMVGNSLLVLGNSMVESVTILSPHFKLRVWCPECVKRGSTGSFSWLG